MSLFRKEAVTHQGARLTGAITLAQPLSIKLTVVILVTIALAVVAFLFTAEYSRKETVKGFLIPNKGVIKSFARQGGVVEKIWVNEGDSVTKNQPLVTLVIAQNSADGTALSSQLVNQLHTQVNLLDEEITQYRAIHKKEQQNLNRKASALHAEHQALTKQLALAEQKLTLLHSQQRTINQLSKRGYASKREQESQQQALLTAKQEKQNIARLLLQQQNQINQTAFEQANLPEQYTLRINQLLRQQAELENQLAQVKNNHSYTITASHAGTVTGIQVVTGEALSPAKAQSTPLLHILPKGATLVAELLLPTRSAGFVSKGQHTRLRFDAFPYQRFGFIQGEITRIDRALLTPNEVQLPIALQEPVYRLQATLNQQQVAAYGSTFALKSGMLFEADIMLEKRTLIEWLLEPIYSLKGRVS